MQTGLHMRYMYILALLLHFCMCFHRRYGVDLSLCLWDRMPGRSGESKTVRRGDIKHSSPIPIEQEKVRKGH
ncbi:hypothetical protein GGI43DRAFT_115783 [Trichoderma evansii]